MLWLTIHYDHHFEVINAQRTRMIWTVDAEGLGVTIFGKPFAAIYDRNLDVAIPNLIAELNNNSSL